MGTVARHRRAEHVSAAPRPAPLAANIRSNRHWGHRADGIGHISPDDVEYALPIESTLRKIYSYTIGLNKLKKPPRPTEADHVH